MPQATRALRLPPQPSRSTCAAPTVTINKASGQADPSKTLPFTYTVTFSSSVTGFDVSDLVRAGTSTGGSASVSGSGSTYTVTLSGSLTEGTAGFTVAAGAAVDIAGNASVASTSTDNLVSYDLTGPSVTVEKAATQPDPTNSDTINFTVTFSEPVTGLVIGDFTVGGTAIRGFTDETLSGSGSTYNVRVENLAAGTVTVTLAAGRATDLAGNNNLASTSVDNSVLYDITRPNFTSTTSGGATLGKIEVGDLMVLVFDEAVDPATLSSTANITLSRATGNTSFSIAGIGTGSFSSSYMPSNSTVTATGSVTFSADKKTVTIIVNAVTGTPLVGNGSATFTVDSTIKDLAGNAIDDRTATLSRLF